MDRRATLAKLFGNSKTQLSQSISEKNMALTLVNSGLDPYTGPYEYEQAAHLLRRSMFGPSNAQIKQSVTDGLDATIEQLFDPQPLPSPPLNYTFTEDPFVAIGETWIDAPYLADINLRGYRHQSLRAWTIGNILNEGVSIIEKMIVFWHNHFVTAEINDPKYIYRYITLIRENALGNFRDFTKLMTVDPSMLRYLNGNQNTDDAPNENYARELLELFTIGKGPAVGQGDYTNYTEDDVVQMARVLTGWRDIGFNTLNPDTEIQSVFIPNRHDTGTKQLSHRFDDMVINDMGENEYAHLIDIIFGKEEVARFISRKLYRWFIYYEISSDAETNVIEPMAQLMIDNDYEIQPALEALLSSEHFFDMLNVGPMIKNPLDFVISSLKNFEVEFPTGNINQEYRMWFQIVRVLPLMQMEYYNPPSVAGWKAYYQEPQFYRMWINSVTMPLRQEITNRLVMQGIQVAGASIQIDVLKFIDSIDDPLDPNSVITEFAAILFPQPITDNQKDALKEILIPGLPDFEWTVEFGDYLNDPTNDDLRIAVENKLRSLIQAMLSMPEFYLS